MAYTEEEVDNRKKNLFFLPERKVEGDGLEFSEMLDSTEEGRVNMLTPAL